MESTPLGIGFDVTHELNEFNQPRIRSEIEVIKDIILFVLFAKPGQYPSLPLIGLDIQNMLYSFYDELDCDKLKQQIIQQCEALGAIFNKNIISIKKTIYRKQPSLLIHIEGKETYPKGYMKDSTSDADRYLIGISFDAFKKMAVSINSQGGV